MIWILADRARLPAAKQIDAELEALGSPTAVVSPDNSSSLAIMLDGLGLRVTLDGIELASPSAVLALGPPVENVSSASDEQRFCEREWTSMLRGLLAAWQFEGTAVINPVDLTIEKTVQLMGAARLGWSTPDTYQGASGAELRRLVPWSDSAMKAFTPFVRTCADGKRFERLLTQRLSTADIATGLTAAANACPSIVQPFVKAQWEHRLMVVGDRIFGARIEREGTAAVDVRRKPVAEAHVSPSRLPTDVHERTIELVRSFGLDLAAIDVLETDDEYIFLELNPSGHFYWIEQLTSQPICRSIAELAIERGSHRTMSDKGAMVPNGF